PVRIDAEKVLSRYSDGSASTLGILERVMRSPTSSYTTVLATQMLEKAAASSFNRKNPSATPTQQANQVKANVTRYQRFQIVLTGLTKSQDQSVSQQAKTTLARLKEWLGQGAPTSNIAQNPPPQP
ncbi:MAG: hypothetical protein AB7F86_17410, partial [Bdellovibrionales bacterium]